MGSTKFQSSRPCLICGRSPTDIDHIKTRGSGGEDKEENYLYLCRTHHVERHRFGMKGLTERYPEIENELNRNGWRFVKEFGVWKLRRITN